MSRKIEYFKARASDRKDIVHNVRSIVTTIKRKLKASGEPVNLLDKQMLAILSDLNIKDYLISIRRNTKDLETEEAHVENVFLTEREDYIIIIDGSDDTNKAVDILTYSSFETQKLMLESRMSVIGDVSTIKTKDVS